MTDSFLAEVPLFASLDAQARQHLARVLHRSSYDAGFVLVREGQTGERFRIIMDGEVEVVKALGTPSERLLRILGPGQFFGEMGLLIDDGRRSATIRTRSPVQLLEMDHAAFDTLLQQQPALGRAILRTIANRMRQSDEAIIQDLEQKNAELAQAYRDLRAAQEQLVEKQRIEVELQTAYRIQKRFLPEQLPTIPGWEVEAYWQPAFAVSGDFYDFFLVAGGRLGVVVGDVTDKGVPAALVMATTLTMLRTIAETATTPSAILQRVNNLLVEQLEPAMFVTCCICILDPANGELVYANAGHVLPYMQTANGSVQLRATGMPLGLMPEMEYEEKRAQLLPGDVLFLYSDGLVEARNAHGEMFGFQRLWQTLNDYHDGCRVIVHLASRLAEFSGREANQEDDVTLVALHHTAL